MLLHIAAVEHMKDKIPLHINTSFFYLYLIKADFTFFFQYFYNIRPIIRQIVIIIQSNLTHGTGFFIIHMYVLFLYFH